MANGDEEGESGNGGGRGYTGGVEWRGVGEDEVTLHVRLIRTLVSTA